MSPISNLPPSRTPHASACGGGPTTCAASASAKAILSSFQTSIASLKRRAAEARPLRPQKKGPYRESDSESQAGRDFRGGDPAVRGQLVLGAAGAGQALRELLGRDEGQCRAHNVRIWPRGRDAE